MKETGEDETVLLVASGRPWLATALDSVLGETGHPVVRAADADELFDKLEGERPGLVVLDAELPGGGTREICEAVAGGPEGPVVPLLVYASGLPDDAWHAAIIDAGAWQLLREPIRARSLVATVRRMLDLRRRVAGSRARLKLREGQELEVSGVLTIRGG